MTESEKIEIVKYQKHCWEAYKNVVGINDDYKYLYGNPVKVHVPIDTTCGGLMIVGAYPTAHFNVIGSERDVPVGDHLYPFSSEKYFDGSRVREVDSGREIEELFLKPLGNLPRDQTWITELVKVFLFKDGHQKKYERLGFKGNLVNRNQFMDLARKSISFIELEIEICKPKVILGLSAEVNAVMLKKSIAVTTDNMENQSRQEIKVNGITYIYFACPHPGILMRGNEISNKWKNVLTKIIGEVNEIL